MADRTIALAPRLFAAKGDARPAPDYVPRLKTDEPARIAPGEAAGEAVAEGDGLAGLIKRRRLPPPPTPAEVEARHAAERLTRTVSEQADNGMLYESLRLGLPLPDLAAAQADREAGSFEEAARARIRRPFALRGARLRPRRKLTVRLAQDDFNRLHAHAEQSGRTYQDILAAATLAHLKEVASPAPSVVARALALFRRR